MFFEISIGNKMYIVASHGTSRLGGTLVQHIFFQL